MYLKPVSGSAHLRISSYNTLASLSFSKCHAQWSGVSKYLTISAIPGSRPCLSAGTSDFQCDRVRRADFLMGHVDHVNHIRLRQLSLPARFGQLTDEGVRSHHWTLCSGHG